MIPPYRSIVHGAFVVVAIDVFALRVAVVVVVVASRVGPFERVVARARFRVVDLARRRAHATSARASVDMRGDARGRARARRPAHAGVALTSRHPYSCA